MPTEAASNGNSVLGVDTHAHVFTQQLQFVSAGESYIPDYDAPIGTFLQKLSKHRLSHAVLVQPSFLGSNNSYLLAAVQEHAEQLRAIVITGPDTAKRELEKMHSQGAVGTRLILYGTEDQDYTSLQWRDYAARIAALDWIVEIYGASSRLRSVCDVFLKANCRILIDHYGRPNPATNVNDEGFFTSWVLQERAVFGLTRQGHIETHKGNWGLTCRNATLANCGNTMVLNGLSGEAIGPVFNLSHGQTTNVPWRFLSRCSLTVTIATKFFERHHNAYLDSDRDSH